MPIHLSTKCFSSKLFISNLSCGNLKKHTIQHFRPILIEVTKALNQTELGALLRDGTSTSGNKAGVVLKPLLFQFIMSCCMCPLLKLS